MSIEGVPGSALPELRAADADRAAAAERLRVACGEGRLTLDEFSERTAEAYAARTLAELDRLTADLPVGTVGTGVAWPAAAVPRRESAPPVVAVFSGAQRQGRWVPAQRETAVAVFGGIGLDYREAELSPEPLQLRAFVLFGGIDVVVPEGVRVEMSGFSLFGGRDVRAEGSLAGPSAPVLRVQAVAVFGGISVKGKARRRR
jgi:hypothetical protein